jgi:pimeloyl-ACP methyl ester carboxylesterase
VSGSGDGGRESELRLPDGRTLAWREYGDPTGVAMIMLHGSPGSRLMFHPADEPAHRLGLRLICPDRAGIGRSSPHAERTLASHAAEIEVLAAHLQLGRFVLFGVSGGAPYAVVAAERLRERLRLLVLVSPMGPIADMPDVPVHPGHRRFFLQLGQLPALARPIARMAAAAFLWKPQHFHRRFAALVGEPDRTTLLRPAIMANVEADIRECLRQGVDGPLRDLILFGRRWGVAPDRIATPTLVWQGTEDSIVPQAVSFALAHRLPDAELVTVDGAGHFWIYDNVEPVLTRIAARVRDLG